MHDKLYLFNEVLELVLVCGRLQLSSNDLSYTWFAHGVSIL